MVVVGCDSCESFLVLVVVLIWGLIEGGVDVCDLGLVGIEEMYFVIVYFGVDGGIEVMVLYNFIDYNGMKFVGVGVVFLDFDMEFVELVVLVCVGGF